MLAKFRFKLKKVGKTTRPFRYDLNQIPYYYTVKVTNRFKGLDLIECLKNYEQRFMTCWGPVSAGSGGYPQDERCRRGKTRETNLDGAKSARETDRKRERKRVTRRGCFLHTSLFMRVLCITFWPWGLLTFYACQVNVNLFSVSMVTLTER